MRLLVSAFLLAIGASVGGDQTPDGLPAQIILPTSQRMKNVGGSDGAGLCVFTSLAHSARHQNVFQLVDFQAWMKTKPGGGYPEKVDQMIDRLCREKGYTKPTYIQVSKLDLEALKRACESGRMPAITYSWSPTGRYGGKKIAHMTNLVHAANGHWGVLDSNMPDTVEWMNEQEFVKSHSGMGGAWFVILLQPGSPPDPRN